MAWTTTAPTLPAGASWSDWKTGNAQTANSYYNFRIQVRCARGETNTVWLAIRFQLYGKDYNTAGSATISLKAQAKVEDNSYSSSSTYDLKASYGEWSTAKTIYYSDEAWYSETVYARLYWTSSSITGAQSFSAPDFVTQYTITYDGNTYTGGETPNSYKTYAYTATISANGYTKGGYVFDHWNTAADNSGTSYSVGGPYTTNADLTLYAIWVYSGVPVILGDLLTIKQLIN